jgi:hypothetical protein
MQIMLITLSEEGITAIVEGLPGFLDKVGDFVRDTLSSRGQNDSVATRLSRPLKLSSVLNNCPV